MHLNKLMILILASSFLWLSGCKKGGDDTPDEETICADGVDNDEDGAIDCADSDCADDPICAATAENCVNGADDDGDGAIDCDDSDCAEHPTCVASEDICDDGLDNDEDGVTDCDDSDCDGDPACAEPVEDICDDELDNDEDGDIDCDDTDCIDDPFCIPPVEICDNGADDDDDGDIDCEDSDCADDPICIVGDEDCTNGEDDDEDGLTDCEDDDCDLDVACEELCNGEDDDGDGRIDEFPVDDEIGDACYDGPADVRGVGICVEGAIECFGGELLCIGWVGPEPVELCDGLDSDCDGETPAEEAAGGCSTDITIGGDLARIEFRTEVRDVDVHINLDTTGSMGGEIDTLSTTLSTTIVPAIREALPTSQFGVSTFDDFPIGSFGSAGDEPFTLHQRVTSNIGIVQAAIDAIPRHSGADGPESGIESLYQIATGAGVGWPGGGGGDETCPEPLSGLYNVTTGIIDPAGDDDAYSISIVAGEILYVDIDAAESDSELDSYLYLYDQADGEQLASNDDTCDYDSRLSYTAEADMDVVIMVSGFGGDSVGWYALQVTLDGVPYVASPDTCSGLEVGGNPFTDGVFDADLTVALEEASTVFPRADAAACVTDCATELGEGEVAEWAADFCNGVESGEGECGNGILEAGEECDDGNTDDGDGCDSLCRDELERIPAFDWEEGFDPGLGHGAVGGVGFRATALPVIVHITDAVSHNCTEYIAAGITAHCPDETFEELNAIGARVVAVRSGAASDDPTDRLYPLGMVMATDSVVPVCAFDGSEARTSGVCGDGQCCTGMSGAGEAPNDDGECPLVFQINGSGAGLDTSMVGAIDSLTQFIRYSLTIAPRDVPTDAVDATCFVDFFEIDSFEGPPGTCGVTPVAVDTDDDGHNDTLEDATPRTRVTYEIHAVNRDVNDVDGDGDVVEPCADPGTYPLYMDVIAEGGTVVATRAVNIIVP